MTPDEIQHVVRKLEVAQHKRKLYIKLETKLSNSTLAYIRIQLGFRADAPEAERAAVNRRAARIRDRLRDGKPQAEEDGEAAMLAGEIVATWVTSAAPISTKRAEQECEMKRLARTLPVWVGFARDLKGFGELGLAVIVAEAHGDNANGPGDYRSVSALWKRLGLAPYQGRAGSTWRSKGGLTAEEWTALGYAPTRLAQLYGVVTEPLFKHQSITHGPYRAAYDARRARTAEAHQDWTKAHSHNDALRIMTKQLVRDLWVAWRLAEQTVSPENGVPAAEPSDAATIPVAA